MTKCASDEAFVYYVFRLLGKNVYLFCGQNTLKPTFVYLLYRFRATMYPCPDTTQERREMALGVITRIEDLQTVIGVF